MSAAHAMFWVRMLDALAARGAQPCVIEAEVATEMLIRGMRTYADGGIVFGRTTIVPDASGLYKYLLRVKEPMPGDPIAFDTIQKMSNRGGDLLPGAPVTELVGLFSLALQSRLFLLSTTERPLDPQYLPRRTDCGVLRATGDIKHLDDTLFSPRTERKIHTGLPPLLDAIRRVPAKHHLELAVAADHHAKALAHRYTRTTLQIQSRECAAGGHHHPQLRRRLERRAPSLRYRACPRRRVALLAIPMEARPKPAAAMAASVTR